MGAWSLNPTPTRFSANFFYTPVNRTADVSVSLKSTLNKTLVLSPYWIQVPTYFTRNQSQRFYVHAADLGGVGVKKFLYRTKPKTQTAQRPTGVLV